MSNKLTIGLFGFGVVGEGIYKVLRETASLKATIKRICIKNPGKPRAADPALFTTRYEDLLEDKDINLIVELIDDSEEAYKIVTTALRQKKAVVSANKKMIAEHLTELLALQQEHNTPLLYEAAVCGSIPIIRNLEEYYDNDLLRSICGIVNGSTNYILTKMLEEGKSYCDALSEAQHLGFAETNPALDVEGMDARNKLVLLLLHAYGLMTTPDKILVRGITQIQSRDARYAAEKGYKIKLTAQAVKLSSDKIAAFVLPQFVNEDSQLFGVKNEYNGIILESKLADKQFLYGKGAGRYPTSSAVLSDIAALRYHYQYEYRKQQRPVPFKLSDDFYLKVYVSFSSWNQLNKWDFEWIEEYQSTADRQYLIGVISYHRLRKAPWMAAPQTALIVMPNGIIEKESVIMRSLKKVSLQLSGIS